MRISRLILILLALLLLLCGCAVESNETIASLQTDGTVLTNPATTTEPATVPTTEVTEQTTTVTTQQTETATVGAEEHSDFYIPGVSADEVITCFIEVCLDAEFINSGDPTVLQKWVDPIVYSCDGAYTDADMQVLTGFVHWLNSIDGFPGMYPEGASTPANLSIHFCGPAEYLTVMGDNFSGTDGGVTFWYNGADEIYNGVIGYRTDVDQQIRNSVILEEIYNGLGPVNDTDHRADSIIYSGFSQPQELTQMDMLILQLLYHPQMECGMNAEACAAVIRELYY